MFSFSSLLVLTSLGVAFSQIPLLLVQSEFLAGRSCSTSREAFVLEFHAGNDTFTVAKLWTGSCHTSFSEGVLTAKSLGDARSPLSITSSTHCRAVAEIREERFPSTVLII